MVLLHQFLEMMVTERGATRSTVSSYEADLCNFYRFLKKKKIECVTFLDIQAYLLTQKHLASSTVGRRLSSLRQFYIFLMSRDIIKENPFPLAESVHPKPGHTPLLNEEEVKRLLEGAKTWSAMEGKRLAALLQLFCVTDLPVKDIVSLPLTVELKEQLLNIEPYLKSSSRALEEGVAIQKTNKKLDCDEAKLLAMTVLGRESYSKTAPLDVYKNEDWVVHLPVPTLEALQEYLKVRNYFLTHGEESPWLFPSLSQKGHLTRQRFGQLLKELILKVGLNSELISLSAIRHSFIHINKV